MIKKRLTKKIWYGSDMDSEGNPIVPPLAEADGDQEGLHHGELYLHIADDKLSLWTRTLTDQVKQIGGGGEGDDLWKLMETESGEKYIFSAYDVVTQKGITMYADGGLLDLPSIYDGLPIDMDTIYWEETTDDNGNTTKILKAKGGEGNGTFGEIEIQGEGNAVTKVEIVEGATEEEADKLVFYKEKTFIEKETLENDYLTKVYIEENYYTKTNIDEVFFKKDEAGGLFVTLDETEQEILGIKTFKNGLCIGASKVYQSQDDVVYIDANLVVRGGITMYGVNEVDSDTIMDGVVVDEKTISKANGYLEVIGGGSGGSIEYPLTWSGFSSGSWDGTSEKSIYIPSKVSELTNDSLYVTSSTLTTTLGDYATEEWVGDYYLPLTGGTLTGHLVATTISGGGSSLYLGNEGNSAYVYINEDMRSVDNDWSISLAGAASFSSLTVNGSFYAKGTLAYMPTGSDSRGFGFAGQYMYVQWDYSSRETILHLDGNNVCVFTKTPQITGGTYLADRTWVNNNYLSLSSGGTVQGNVTLASGTTLYVETVRTLAGKWVLGGNNNLAFGGNNEGYYTSLTGATLKLYGGTTEKIRITSSNIFVYQSGWTDDGLKLTRNATDGGCAISVYGLETYKGCFGVSGSETFEFHSNTNGLCFSVDKGGNGIFKANTGFGLTIDRTSSNGGAYTRYRPNNQTNQSWTVGASNGYYFSVYYQNVASGIDAKKMTLGADGNLLVTGGITMYGTSDQRLKRNIRTFKAGEELMKMGGVYEFEYVDDEVKRNERYQGSHFGLIYQNVKDSSLSKMCYEREDGYGALNYLDTSFISLLAAVGMEHETRLQKLERENKELRMEVEQLKNR